MGMGELAPRKGREANWTLAPMRHRNNVSIGSQAVREAGPPYLVRV